MSALYDLSGPVIVEVGGTFTDVKTPHPVPIVHSHMDAEHYVDKVLAEIDLPPVQRTALHIVDVLRAGAEQPKNRMVKMQPEMFLDILSLATSEQDSSADSVSQAA